MSVSAQRAKIILKATNWRIICSVMQATTRSKAAQAATIWKAAKTTIPTISKITTPYPTAICAAKSFSRIRFPLPKHQKKPFSAMMPFLLSSLNQKTMPTNGKRRIQKANIILSPQNVKATIWSSAMLPIPSPSKTSSPAPPTPKIPAAHCGPVWASNCSINRQARLRFTARLRSSL